MMHTRELNIDNNSDDRTELIGKMIVDCWVDDELKLVLLLSTGDKITASGEEDGSLLVELVREK